MREEEEDELVLARRGSEEREGKRDWREEGWRRTRELTTDRTTSVGALRSLKGATPKCMLEEEDGEEELEVSFEREEGRWRKDEPCVDDEESLVRRGFGGEVSSGREPWEEK